MTHQAAGEAVSVQVVLQQAGEAEEGQAGLLQAELDGLRGPHTGDQLRRKQRQRPINNWHDSSLIIPVMYLSSSSTTARDGSPERSAVSQPDARLAQSEREEVWSGLGGLTHHGGFLWVRPVDAVALGELADGVTEQRFEGLVGVGGVLRRDEEGAR